MWAVLFLPIWSSSAQGLLSPLREQPWHRLPTIKCVCACVCVEGGGCSEQPSSAPLPSLSAIHSYCDKWARVPRRHAQHQTTVSCLSVTKIVLSVSAAASWVLTRVDLTKREMGYNLPRGCRGGAAWCSLYSRLNDPVAERRHITCRTRLKLQICSEDFM